jgi:hypothetical protein
MKHGHKHNTDTNTEMNQYVTIDNACEMLNKQQLRSSCEFSGTLILTSSVIIRQVVYGRNYIILFFGSNFSQQIRLTKTREE